VRFLLVVLSLFLLGQPMQAQEAAHVTFRPAQTELRGEAGGRCALRVELRVDRGWHIYAPALPEEKGLLGFVPLVATTQRPEVLQLEGDLACSLPRKVWDAGFQRNRRILAGSAWVELPLRIAPSLPAGTYQVALGLRFQACTEENCLPPAQVRLTLPLVVTRGPAPGVMAVPVAATLATAGASPGPKPPPTTDAGLWGFLVLAALAGGAALLTPCVFPMVPITLSFFTQRAERSSSRSLRDALAFSVGIVASFTALGLALTLLFGATGLQAFATHPALNLGLALLFVGFALSLFGWVRIALPAGLAARLGPQGGGSGLLSVGLMGLTFTLTSFTCTMPFVGTALVAASTGAWFRPALGMLVFSSVFAAPFFLLARFPALLPRLPRSGAWMGRLKAILGLVELAAALKFVSNADLVMGWGLLPRERFLGLWALCAWAIALSLLWPLRALGWRRALAAALFLGLGLHLGTGAKGLGGWDAFFPPSATAEAGWRTDYARALGEARRTGRPLFLDFTGVTCTNCRWMETQMFPRPAVARALEGFIKVRLFTDRQEAGDVANQRLQQERFQTVALPLYAILGPEGSLRRTASFTRDEGAFLAFLEK
jgi:thiol:disulfide interchange protein